MAHEMQEQDQFYYKTPELSHRYELILHLLEYSNHLILVAGEKDTGKSSLFEQLETPDESSLVLRKLTATAHTTENDILNTLVTDLNASADTFDPWGVSIDDFNHWLSRCHSKQQVPAILIDDVDLLPDEIINYIFSDLSMPRDEAVLHVCLFCEPSFLDLARDKEDGENDSRSLHIIEMPNFNEKQTAQYLTQRYPDDENGLSVFDEKTIKQIHRISHGMPGRIDVLAEQYLNDPAKQVPEADIPETVTVAGSGKKNRSIYIVGFLLLLLSVGITFLLYQTDESQPAEQIKLELPPTTVQTPAAQEPAPAPVIAESIPVEEPEPPAIEELTPPVLPELAADLQIKEEPVSDIIIPEPEQVQIEEPAAQAEATSELVINKIEVVTEQAGPAQLLELPEEPVAETIVADAAVSEQETIVNLAASSSEDSEAESRIDVQTRLLTPELIETEPAAEPTVAETSSTKPTPQQQPEPKTNDINWLLQQDPNKYVLQLIGAFEKQTIDQYLQRFNNASDKIVRFSTINNGKPWHVLVYGLYANRQQAVTAIESLPEQARQLQPWPRPIKSLRQLEITGETVN